jgi:hypothetical protein
LNGTLYFVDTEEDRGKLKYLLAKPDDPYGMGYYEAECSHEMKFTIDEANFKD